MTSSTKTLQINVYLQSETVSRSFATFGQLLSFEV